MDTRNGFIETIGNTPLIRLRVASEATGGEILGMEAIGVLAE